MDTRKKVLIENWMGMIMTARLESDGSAAVYADCTCYRGEMHYLPGQFKVIREVLADGSLGPRI